MFQKFSSVEEKLWIKDGGGGVSGYSVEMFLSQSAEKNCRVTLQCFRSFLVWEKIYGEEMGVLLFPVENFLFHSAKKNLSFEKILVSKIFMHRSGEATMICRNFFVSHDWKTSYWVPSVFQKFSRMEKSLWIKDGGGGVSGYSVENVFVSQCRKISWGNHSMFQKNWGSEKNLCIRRGYHYSPLIFFVSQCRHFS